MMISANRLNSFFYIILKRLKKFLLSMYLKCTWYNNNTTFLTRSLIDKQVSITDMYIDDLILYNIFASTRHHYFDLISF